MSDSEAIDRAEERSELIATFVETNPAYYEQEFEKIGATSQFTWTFNWVAALLGPVWFGMRGVWNWGLPFVILETFALIQIARGLFGDLGAGARHQMASVVKVLDLNYRKLDKAIEKGLDAKIPKLQETIASLEASMSSYENAVTTAENSAFWVALFGLLALVVVKAGEGFLANTILEKRFSAWLSDRTINSGLSWPRTLTTVVFIAIVLAACVIEFVFPNWIEVLSVFPTTDAIRLTTIEWIEYLFDLARKNASWFFLSIIFAIRSVLDFLELLFVATPWIVIFSFIVLLTALAAGKEAALFSAGFLAYMGLWGFWDKAMTTLALLGTAACLSILIGIPLGMYCARRPRLYSVIRPIMDFMQTMPAFVFMIPVIAFFGTGKPAAVITTMIFGGTPVVRLTVLGLRGVPESIREAAIAYGASKWYLLRKVDLPLAAPSILTGVNQTIMLSLAMVVIASLIGAKGLGEDVLEGLNYGSIGQGILAGFAILFCALILNRIVQGQRGQ